MKTYSPKIVPLFLILIVGSIILMIASRELIVTNEVLQNYLIQQHSIDQIQNLIDSKDEFEWVRYALLPLVYLAKLSLISLWFICGFILFGYKNSFKEIFQVVLVSEFLWLVPPFLTFAWFGLIDTDYTLIDVKYFKPFSLLSIFDASKIDSWLIFPLKSLNLFEVAYMLILAIGIKRILKKNYKTALNFTIPVYGTALVTWIVFITFLKINLTT